MTRTQQPAGGPGMCVYPLHNQRFAEDAAAFHAALRARMAAGPLIHLGAGMDLAATADEGNQLGRRCRTLLLVALALAVLGMLALGGLR